MLLSKSIKLFSIIGAGIILSSLFMLLLSKIISKSHIQTSQGIAGTDNDGNGIWDYIDQYIEETFPSAEAAPIRAAARQYALAHQEGMLNADNRDLSMKIAVESGHATFCMIYHNKNAYEDLDKLDVAILNTADRTRAYLTYNDQLGGGIFRLPPEELYPTFCKN